MNRVRPGLLAVAVPNAAKTKEKPAPAGFQSALTQASAAEVHRATETHPATDEQRGGGLVGPSQRTRLELAGHELQQRPVAAAQQVDRAVASLQAPTHRAEDHALSTSSTGTMSSPVRSRASRMELERPPPEKPAAIRLATTEVPSTPPRSPSTSTQNDERTEQPRRANPPHLHASDEGLEPTASTPLREPLRGRAEPKKGPPRSTDTDTLLLVSRALVPTAAPKLPAATAPQAPSLVGVDQLATRAKGLVEHTRVSLRAPLEPKAHETDRARAPKDTERAFDELAKPNASELAAPPRSDPSAPSTEPPRLDLVAPPPEAAALSNLAPLLLEDPSVRAVLLPTVARLSLETADRGALTVQLKVNDGVTEVKASGPAASLLEHRQGELKVALAKEGLALGHFDLTQSGSGSQRRDHHDRAEPSPAPTAPRRTSTPAITTDGGIHVTA